MRTGRAARRLALLAGAWLVMISAGCGKTERLSKAAGSALWVEPGGLESVEPGLLDRLRDSGVGEVFLTGSELAWQGDRPKISLGVFEGLPRRSPVTLVVRGAWPVGALAGPLAEPEELGGVLGGELDRLRLAAEARGLLVVGVHLDLQGPEPEALRPLSEMLGEVAGQFGEGRYLSIELDRRWLGLEDVQRVADAVDFVTCRLYGQPIEQREERTLWQHDQILEAALQLDALGSGYLIGVTTVGGLLRLDAKGQQVEATSAGAGLGDLVSGRAFERSHGGGFLEGLDRRVLTFSVKRPTTLAGWRLSTGDQVRTVELREHDLRRLLDRLRFAQLQHHLGQLYIRAPRDGEEQALSLTALAGAVSGVLTEADLRAELRNVQAVRGGLSFRVAVVNAGERDTDVAYLATNFVDVIAPGGVVASAQAGGFLRYEKQLAGRPVTDMRAFRSADSVRLFIPLLEAGDSVVSGPVVVRTRSGRVVVGGTFSLPGGEMFELPEIGLP